MLSQSQVAKEGVGWDGSLRFYSTHVLHKKLIDLSHFSCKERIFGGGPY